MNLRVDLIYPTEQRSASPVSLKLVTQLLVALIILGGGFVVTKNVIAIADLKARLGEQERMWQEVAPSKARAEKLIKEAAENLEILAELEGWRHSRLDWAPRLLTLAQMVPEEIQLTTLRVQHNFTVLKKEKVARAYTIRLSGGCSGEEAATYVASLENRMAISEALGPLKEISARSFGIDPENKDSFVFAVTYPFEARSF